MAYTLQFAKTDELAATLNSGATSTTLLNGNFGSPSGTQLYVVDYDVSAKAEIISGTVAGTAVTSITRGLTGGAAGTTNHAVGAKVGSIFVPQHYSALVDGSGLTLTSLPNNTITANHLATSAIKLGTATASGQSGVTTVVDVTGCSVTVTIPAGGRSVLVMAVGSASSSSASGLTSFDIQAAGSNMTGGNFRVTHNNNTNSFTGMGFAVETPSAGSRTYKLRATGVVGTSAIDASTNLVVLLI